VSNDVKVLSSTTSRVAMTSPWYLLDELTHDVRFAFRTLRKSRGFAATVILTLALGIGANAAMFGVVDRLMFRPYAYLRDPSTVHRVYLRATYRGTTSTSWHTEYVRYLDLKRWSRSFDEWSGFATRPMAVGVGDASRERQVAAVNATFFRFFDAPPALGRYFVAAEDTTPRGADVAVLGYGFWKSEFGGRNVLGEVLQVGNIPATIVGVAPEGFAGVDDANPPVVYIPITTYAGSQPTERTNPKYYTRYNWGWLEMMVRRKPGVTVEQASRDLSQAYVRSWNAEREIEPTTTPVEIAKPNAIAGAMKLGAGPDPSLEARTALWVTGVAAIVLLIACANVANLFLARALRRQREIAVRLALGVSRRRLMMQTLTESLVLSLIGSAAGLLVAQWGGLAIRRLLISSEGASLDVVTDWRTLGVAVGAAMVAGLLTGLAPALLSGRGDLARALKAGPREGTYHRSRTRVTLLVLQGALSVVLLVGAGLFVRSLGNVKAMRMGYDAEPLLLVTRNMRGMDLSDSARAQLGRTLLATAQEISGVESATWVSSVPFWSTSSTGLYVTGIDSVRKLGRFTYQTATTDYFTTMGTRILRGRGFTEADRANAPKISVVSESMAKVLWPGKDALGQCMRVRADTMPCTTVVGIAEDMVQGDLTSDKKYQYYLPLEQASPSGGFVMLRMRGDPAAQQEAVRKAMQRVMPGQSYVTTKPFIEIVDEQRRSWQLGATMFVAFGVLALVVAAVGLYGVIGYNVTQRMHELGVRVALGAQARDILGLVVGQGVRFALAGVALGTLLAYAASRWLEPLLFRQSARDPVVYTAVGTVLVLVALAASGAPAVRASRADPNSALRSE
jgi:putative ABC transport system permease protein